MIKENESYYVVRQNGVLMYYNGVQNAEADTTVTCTKMQFIGSMMQMDVPEPVIEGDSTILDSLTKYMKNVGPYFNIIEP